MICSIKAELILSEETRKILDGQSKILNYLYNYLLETVNNEYLEKRKESKLLQGYNIRDLIPKLKENKPFLKTVHSSPLKNVGLRLKQSFVNYFTADQIKHPKYLSWKRKWFSLLYDEPNKGIKIDNENIKISLGQDETGKRLYVHGIIKQDNYYHQMMENSQVRNYRITKDKNKYYLIICINKDINKDKKVDERLGKRFIAIDPNHKNFFVGIDYFGNTIEMNNFSSIKYLDKKIDELKSKRDKCQKKSKTKEHKSSKKYYQYNKALEKLYIKRREQIKTFMYTISNKLTDNYDIIAIGDYTPSVDSSKYKNMHRSMLNQTIIGEFRRILNWVCLKKKKELIIVNEENTTKECCNCHHQEKKDPNIREFICPNCGIKIERDKNSAINIANKEKLILSGSDYLIKDNNFIKYTTSYSYKTNKVTIEKINDYTDKLFISLINNRDKINEMYRFV